MTSTGLCGPGFYGVGSGESTTIEFATYDCEFVPDEYEGQYFANDGTVLIDAVQGGDVPGDYTGIRLLTELAGSVEATASNGIEVVIQFDIAAYIRGDDSEETEWPASGLTIRLGATQARWRLIRSPTLFFPLCRRHRLECQCVHAAQPFHLPEPGTLPDVSAQAVSPESHQQPRTG